MYLGLTDWFRGNKLSLNVAKTNYMLFSNHILFDESPDLKIADQNIIQTNCSKFLGIQIDDKLKWNIHINKVKSHISSSLFTIDKIKHFAPKKFNALSSSYLVNYPMWCNIQVQCK